jgi:adenylylsulfate kinase
VIERAALLSGTVGAGKTTVGEELAELLKDRGEAHAFIDLDGLSELWPAPEDDRFNGRLVLANLAAITRNFAAAGARTLVMSGVVDHGRREISPGHWGVPANRSPGYGLARIDCRPTAKAS